MYENKKISIASTKQEISISYDCLINKFASKPLELSKRAAMKYDSLKQIGNLELNKRCQETN